MEEKWRLIEKNFSSQPESAAFQSAILKLREEGKINDTCLFRFVPDLHVTLGYYEDASSDIDLDACRALNIPVKRRAISGGSAALLGPNYAGFSVCIDADKMGLNIEALYQRVLFNLMDEVSRVFKVPTRYKPLNDGEIWYNKEKRWRKIALSNVSGEGNVLLFGGSVTLSQPRVDLMSRVLTPASKKFSDKDAKHFRDRVGFLESEVGRPVNIREIRRVYIDTLERAFSVKLVEDEPTKEEMHVYNELKQIYIEGDRWTMARSDERFAEMASQSTRGEHLVKIPNGPIFKAKLVVEKNKISEIMFTGSMSCTPSDFFERLEDLLRGSPANSEAVQLAVAKIYSSGFKVACLDEGDITTTVLEALKDAKIGEIK